MSILASRCNGTWRWRGFQKTFAAAVHARGHTGIEEYIVSPRIPQQVSKLKEILSGWEGGQPNC